MRRLIGSLGLALAALLGLGASLALGADSWLMSGHDAAETNFNGGERTIGRTNVARLRQVWSFPGATQAIATDRRVFVAASSSSRWMVAVLDTLDGKVLRTFTSTALGLTGRPGDYPDALAYARGKLLVGTASNLLAFDPLNGRLYWRAAGGAGYLAVNGSTVYTGQSCPSTTSSCGNVASSALDVQTGKVLWRHPGGGGGQPVLVAGRLFQLWQTSAPETRVYEPDGGQLAATLPLSAAWTGDEAAAYAAVSTGQGKAWWLGRIASTGKPLWKVSLGRVAGSSPPVFAYGTLYVTSNRFHPGVLAVNARNGKVSWGADVGGSVRLIAANHLIYVLHQTTGRLDVLDASTGAVVSRLIPSPYAAGGSAQLFVSGDTLYVVVGGRLVALRP